MDKISQTIELMMHFNMIPKDKGFEITQKHIDDYGVVYREITLRKETTKLNKSTIRLNDKYSGLNLLNLNLSRGYTPLAGIVYLIENPAFPTYYKVGITSNLNKRLASYQTYDPLRRYKVKHYNFVFDKRSLEKEILNNLKTYSSVGEWITEDKKDKFLEYLLHYPTVI